MHDAAVTNSPESLATRPAESLHAQVRSAVFWRTGTQILGQAIAWLSTFVVIRLLDPADYGLFAMTQVVLFLLNMLNGYGLANAVIQKAEVTRRDLRQLMGMLVLLNLSLALVQLLLAPVAAAYYRQPVVADLLHVQALLYLTTPFSAFGYALLARQMRFDAQSKVNLASAVLGALAAIGGASLGWGVWTLVYAPLVLFGTRAVGMTIATRTLVMPSFDFRGAGAMARFGGLVAASQLLGFLQFQADVLIAGRLFAPEAVGFYTTGLFLAQLFNNKFLPALNEISFSAYARIKSDPLAPGRALVRSVRLIMIVAMPFYFGLAVTAEPVVALVLGPKWLGAAPLVQLIALAMPAMTVQMLLQPASDAIGRPGIAAGNSAIGAVIVPLAFLVGAQWGVTGIAASWLVAYPLLLLICARRTLPVLGVTGMQVVRAAAPAVIAACAMALIVTLADSALAAPAAFRLPLLIALGAASYAGWLAVFARSTVVELMALVRRTG
ncbi:MULTISPECIES: lipopolysaccharide biosynthesis protein [unclassified Sphingomonas]|uniref:lipopolysaccharide biosynthesis protein n=1 Tax=unclassified Sphingomonas TaxID=196159 RepID=UPI0008320929|nr:MULTISPECIES: lipopolysaccharide biosynthesis protein [unclassified Sphingomonas]